MKNVMTFLLAAVLLLGAAPATEAQMAKALTTTEANQLLQRVVGNWELRHFVKEYTFDTEALRETKGSASFSKGFQGDYVHEQFELEQPDGSTIQGEGFIRYSEDRRQFEFVQLDKKGKSVVMMTGKWYPYFNTLHFRPVKGSGQWSQRIDPHMQCLYVFKEDGTFIRLTRTLDQYGNYRITSQDHYAYPRVAKK